MPIRRRRSKPRKTQRNGRRLWTRCAPFARPTRFPRTDNKSANRSIVVEDLADLLDERSRREWLLQKMQAGFEHAVVRDGVVAVTRHPEDAGLGAGFADACGEIAPAGLGHDDVGQ